MLNLPNTSRSFNTSSATLNPLQIPSSRVKENQKTFHPSIIDPKKRRGESDYQELQQVFQLLGWHKVPDVLSRNL